MKAIFQRVSQAAVIIDGETVGQIDKGLLILLGIAPEDGQQDGEYLIQKITQMRIFSDENGKMNLSIQDVGGDVIIVSQFTLFAETKKGNRPSFMDSAQPDMAIPLYQTFIKHFKENFNGNVQTGQFGADMKVSLINDGPVTIIIDSKQR
jgi:D-tyrosyl-tRNA(Tyr) deacylase